MLDGLALHLAMAHTRLIVFTDLDGTLRDETGRIYRASLAAVRKLQSLGMPVILCSSKTRAEVEPVWRDLALQEPFIFENGGAICYNTGYFSFEIERARSDGKLSIIELGTRVEELRGGLTEASRRLHIRVRSFSDMNPKEISDLTGMTRVQAQAAALRDYDEPFLVDDPGREHMLTTALRMKGFTVTRRERFLHLSRGSDKGKAARLVAELYRRDGEAWLTIGLGNSADDLALLLAIERPILIRNADRTWDSVITQNLPGIRKTMRPGPEGWADSVEKLLEEIA
jgi:mannosyl-3-phosphoglycerate phosphatase family protein